MAKTTLVKDVITIEGIIPAAKSKFGKGSVVVKFNGRDEYLNFNEGVSEAAFEKGSTYEVELSISEKGKRYLNKVFGKVVEGKPVTQKKETPPKAKKEAPAFHSATETKVDWAAKDRAMAAGGILHDAAALFAPNASGLSADEVISGVQEIAVKLVTVKRAVEKELGG